MTEKQGAQPDKYLTGTKVDERYGISHVTRWRWQQDADLDFPKPAMKINKTSYWLLSELEAWEAKQRAAA